MFYKTITGGCVNNISKNSGGTEITETEYNAILDAIYNRPTAPDGYGYRLREDLTWELYELPVVEEVEQYTEQQLAAMSNAELQAVMADMGIGGTMNKANMVALIMSHQQEAM